MSALEQANRKLGWPVMGLKRVYVFGLKSSVSEGKSARFTFSRGWAHLANLQREFDLLVNNKLMTRLEAEATAKRAFEASFIRG